MGVCTSSSKRKKKELVKVKIPVKEEKNKPDIKEGTLTSRGSNENNLEKMMGKIKENEIRRNNTIQTDVDIGNKKRREMTFPNLEEFEHMNTESIPLSSMQEKYKSKENNNVNMKTEQTEKKSEKGSININNINFIKSKDDNTIATIKMDELNIINKNEINNVNNKEEQSNNINDDKNNEEDITSNKNKDEKKIENSQQNKEEISNKNKEESINKNNNQIKIENSIEKNTLNKKSNDNNLENEIIKQNKNQNETEFFEEESLNISILKDMRESNIYDNTNKSTYKNLSDNKNLYESIKGNLFNLDYEIKSDLNEPNSYVNKENNDLYYFSEFHFTQNKFYSAEKDFNNLLNSQIFQNKIILANRLLNIQERQWYKESISLSDSLKINRENTYLDTASFNLYLNKIINLYNHFNWLVWALGYYYCNSLMFNKNHWFNAKNSNLPSYDSLDWIRGFEWKGLFIKVQTYHDSKKIIKEIKALKYAFLDYIQIIDNFKYKENMTKLNLLSNEIIFPFTSYIYFGGIIIYVSASIKKFCYEDNSIMDYDIKRENMNSNNNSNTKSNTNTNRNTFDIKDKQFDEISEVPINYKKKISNLNVNNNDINEEKVEFKNFLKFNGDNISLNENLINNDINISSYSKVDLDNSVILSKITENNLIKVFDDINANSNINSEKYKFMLTNIYSLLPNLFDKSEIENKADNISYIKYKNDYQNPRIYEITQNNLKINELNELNKMLDGRVTESNIKIYQNYFNGINYRIIYQSDNGERNEKVTNYFVKFPFIQNRELSEIIINQYLKKKNINFLMHNFQINHKQEITNNNIILFKNNLQPKMKYSIIAKVNKSLNIEDFHSFINNICENIKSYKIEIRNYDNLLNFCERFGLNMIFLPFIISKINNKNIINIIKIYLFSNIIKQFFCYNQGQNLLLKLSIYEACKDKDILNSTDTDVRDNNMIELQRTLLVNIIKFFLLPSQYTDSATSIDYGKKYFVMNFMENLSFFVFIHTLKIKKFEKFLNFSQTFLSKMNVKEIIKEYSIICRNNPFLFIDTLEKIINFRMNPYLKYRASLDIENLKELKKEEIVIFAPKINSFIDFSSIAGYIFAKSVGNINNFNNSLNNLLLSQSNINATTKIGKIDSYMINNYNSKYNINYNNITRRIQDINDEENITISNNGMEDMSISLSGHINNNPELHFKNKFINNNNINNKNDINEDIKDKNQKLSLKNVLNNLILDSFLPPIIYKNYFNKGTQNILSKYLTNNYSIPNEEILIDYTNSIEKIIGETISFNGEAEMIIFKSNIYKVLKLIFFVRNLKGAKEIINKMRDKFEKQYLYTFNQCSIFAFLESITYEKYGDSQDFYSKALIFALFNLGDVRCNNCYGHPYILLPLYILCKITGYLENYDTNEYFKEMFRCLNFKTNKNAKMKGLDEKTKKLVYYCFPSVSDLKLQVNDFLYEKDFIIFLFNSILSFFYSGDNLLIDNDYMSYNKINFRVSKQEENNLEASLDHSNNRVNNNDIKENPSHFIIDILLDKMSYLKYGPSNIIFSFGDNKLNQTSHDGYDMLTLPRLVYKICDLKVKKIFSGYNYNFIIDYDNNVYSWGDNSSGQCGLGDKIIIKSPNKLFFPELQENDFIENIICGNNTTYFISNKEKLFLCGFNYILKKFFYFPTLLEINFDSKVVQIKSGEDFSLFLTDKGDVYSIGFGSEGQLGIKNILYEYEQKKYCPKPTKIINSIKYISCGNKHCFAISNKGDIFCWGKNDKGQLGLNFCEHMKERKDSFCILSPLKLQDYLGDIEIKDIICGSNFTFFQTKNDDLLACGNNDKEQLGIQENKTFQKSLNKICNDYITPTEIEQFFKLKAVKIACGEEHCLAIIKDTISNLENIWCWGANQFGQIGLGSYVKKSKPKPNHFLLEFINHKILDISAGKNHSMILLQRKDYNELNNDETLTNLIFKYSLI